MVSPVTRSSVLGKRPHNPDPSTPENVPPFNTDAIASPPSPRATRLRRTTTSDGSPTRVRPSISRRASTSAIVPATPTAEIAQLTLATPPPTPPNSLLPVHARARALLRATCNSLATEMAGRDSERAAISAFFASLIDEADATALVNSVLRALDVNEVKVITINCMALNSVDALWERLTEELGATAAKKRKTAGRPKKQLARDAVDALLAVLPTKCIIILDELDHIAPTTQSLTSLFSISASRPSALRVVGIANTHTLTASSSAGFVPTSSHVRTLHFAPYTPAQLLQILQSRLAPLYVSDASEDAESAESASQAAKKFLSPPALNLLTKKIAALTGDVRSLFEVLRGAIDLAVASPSSTPSPTPTRAERIPLIRLRRHMHLLHRLLLQWEVAHLRPQQTAKSASRPASPFLPTSNSSSPVKRGTTASTPAFGGVDPRTTARVLHRHPVSLVRRRVLARVAQRVWGPHRHAGGRRARGVPLVRGHAVCSLLISRREGQACVRALGVLWLWREPRGGGAGDVQLASAVRTDEVLRGLGIGMVEAAEEDVAAEEVNAIWVKESGKLARDTTARDNKAKKDNSKTTAGFDDAMED
ncbi:Cdc6B protein [Mycena olivaceomarginata]|nr:Cdc6B protein [Mycena olivaceomarginata]